MISFHSRQRIITEPKVYPEPKPLVSYFTSYLPLVYWSSVSFESCFGDFEAGKSDSELADLFRLRRVGYGGGKK